MGEMKKTLFIGIDPGVTGAVAIVDLESGMSSVVDMPLTDENEVDALLLYKKIVALTLITSFENILCVLEKQQSMQKQGVRSTFTTGKNYGKLLALLEISSVTVLKVHPSSWKKYMGLSKVKKQSVDMANLLFSDHNFYGPRGGLKDGRAEAILMCEYGRLKEEEKGRK